MKLSPALVAAASLLAVGVFAAGLIVRPLVVVPKETWLKVAAPSIAMRGKPYTIVVRLESSASGGFIQADLHGLDASKRYLRFESGSARQPVVQGQREYSFEILPPSGGEAAYIQGIIYLSLRGSWPSRTAAARLEMAPIVPAASEDELRPRPVDAFAVSDRYEPPRSDIFALQLAVAFAWASCALLLFVARRGPRAALLPLACLAACLWELLLPDLAISELFRRAIKIEGLYSVRRGPQILVSLAAIAAGLIGASFIFRQSIRSGRFARGLAWIAVLAYAGAAALRVISEHAVDVLFVKSLAGIQVGQWTRMLCAVMALIAALAALATSKAGADRGSA